MRRICLASLLLVLPLTGGCVHSSPVEGERTVEEDSSVDSAAQLELVPQIPVVVLDPSCEVSTDCAADDYCFGGTCEPRPEEYDDETGYPGLDTHEGVCRVTLYDSHNQIESTLQAEQINDVLFVVTAGMGAEGQWPVEAVLYEDGTMEIDAGVPDVDYEELVTEYELKDTGQLTFEQPDGYLCSEFERALIYFLIWEWFFYG